MPNSSPACSTYCLHIFVNSVLNNLDLLGFANTIWFLLCRDCDLILKVWLPLLGKLNGSSRWHCTAPARGCNDSEFLAPGRLPRVREWSDGLQFKKGKEDLMIGPPASREAESPSNRVLWVLWIRSERDSVIEQLPAPHIDKQTKDICVQSRFSQIKFWNQWIGLFTCSRRTFHSVPHPGP